MPRTKAPPVKKQRVGEEAVLPLDDAALLAHAERVVQQLEANEVEQWEKCVATQSSHIDFAAVPAAAAGLVKVALSAEDHAVFRELHDTIVGLHQGEGGAPAEAAQPVAASPAPVAPAAAAPAPTAGESEPAPEPAPAPAPAPAAASADKAMAGWGGTDDRSGRQRCYGYVGTPLGLQHFDGSHAMREYSGDKAEVDRSAQPLTLTLTLALALTLTLTLTLTKDRAAAPGDGSFGRRLLSPDAPQTISDRISSVLSSLVDALSPQPGRRAAGTSTSRTFWERISDARSPRSSPQSPREMRRRLEESDVELTRTATAAPSATQYGRYRQG